MKPEAIAGKTVVLTGKFKELVRADAEAALARMGATIGSGLPGTDPATIIRRVDASGQPVDEDGAPIAE